MNKKFALAAIASPFALALTAAIGFFAFTSADANACTSACGMKYKAECGNGITIWTDSAEGVLTACRGGRAPVSNSHPTVKKPQKVITAKPAPVIRKPATPEKIIRKPARAETIIVSGGGGFIRPTPPACRKGQQDFTRWADATLNKYGLTIICDKEYGGLNLKPANSAEPVRINGKIMRFNKAYSFGPQTTASVYKDGGDVLLIQTGEGLVAYKSGFFGGAKLAK
ncbi:MAG: hypothetical protein EON60_10010 [Alphaproteobacteria bacterium]|nr:MAG: hypothetical protein EON60_10010 [Alphaproteobacteria bacterium]